MASTVRLPICPLCGIVTPTAVSGVCASSHTPDDHRPKPNITVAPRAEEGATALQKPDRLPPPALVVWALATKGPELVAIWGPEVRPRRCTGFQLKTKSCI